MISHDEGYWSIWNQAILEPLGRRDGGGGLIGDDHSGCLSLLANLRCGNLSRIERIVVIVPTGLEIIPLGIVGLLAWRSSELRSLSYLLALEILTNLGLAGWDLGLHLVKFSNSSFEAQDTALAVASSIPLLFLLLFSTLFIVSILFRNLPTRWKGRAAMHGFAILVAPLIPISFVSGLLGSFFLAAYEEKGRNVAVGFQTKSDEMTHFILSFVGAIAGSIYLSFAAILSLANLCHPNSKDERRHSLPDGETGLVLATIGFILATTELAISTVPHSFPLILSRHFIRLLSRITLSASLYTLSPSVGASAHRRQLTIDSSTPASATEASQNWGKSLSISGSGIGRTIAENRKTTLPTRLVIGAPLTGTFKHLDTAQTRQFHSSQKVYRGREPDFETPTKVVVIPAERVVVRVPKTRAPILSFTSSISSRGSLGSINRMVQARPISPIEEESIGLAISPNSIPNSTKRYAGSIYAPSVIENTPSMYGSDDAGPSWRKDLIPPLPIPESPYPKIGPLVVTNMDPSPDGPSAATTTTLTKPNLIPHPFPSNGDSISEFGASINSDLDYDHDVDVSAVEGVGVRVRVGDIPHYKFGNLTISESLPRVVSMKHRPEQRASSPSTTMEKDGGEGTIEQARPESSLQRAGSYASSRAAAGEGASSSTTTTTVGGSTNVPPPRPPRRVRRETDPSMAIEPPDLKATFDDQGHRITLDTKISDPFSLSSFESLSSPGSASTRALPLSNTRDSDSRSIGKSSLFFVSPTLPSPTSLYSPTATAKGRYPSYFRPAESADDLKIETVSNVDNEIDSDDGKKRIEHDKREIDVVLQSLRRLQRETGIPTDPRRLVVMEEDDDDIGHSVDVMVGSSDGDRDWVSDDSGSFRSGPDIDVEKGLRRVGIDVRAKEKAWSVRNMGEAF